MNKKEKKLYAELNDYEGCVRLACKIGETRAQAYRAMFSILLRKPSEGALMAVYARERKLKGSITSLDDDGIETLQKQVMRGRLDAYSPGYIMLLKDKYRVAYRDYYYDSNKANLAAMQHYEQRLSQVGVTGGALKALQHISKKSGDK